MALEEFGVTPVGDCTGMLNWPSLKTPYQNSWAENDGLDVYLDDICLGGNSGTLDVAYADGYDAMDVNLHAVLMSQRYTIFWFVELGVMIPARYTGETNADADGTRTGRLKFALDHPLCEPWTIDGVSNPYRFGSWREYPSGANDIYFENDLDGELFCDLYGISALDGVRNALAGHGDVKALRVANMAGKTGVTPMGGALRTDAREAVLPICMKAATPEALMQNYIQLLEYISNKCVQNVTFGGRTYAFYYVRQNLDYLDWEGDRAILTMKITIKLI